MKLEISSVHVMHTMKLRFHEQTDIRYNPTRFPPRVMDWHVKRNE